MLNQKMERKSDPEEQGAIARLGVTLADWCEKWFPDAYVFAIFAVVIVCAAALAMGRSPTQVSVDFGKSFWNLIPFTMQMAFVVIGGYIVAVAPPVRRVIDVLARFPKTPKVAVAYVGFMAMFTSLLSWGFSMIFAASCYVKSANAFPASITVPWVLPVIWDWEVSGPWACHRRLHC